MKYQVRRAGGKSGDSWQIIYMDLMTIVMVFFVILWSINQGKSEGISDTVGDVTTRMINLPGDVLFAPGQAVLNDSGKDVIKKLFGGDQSVLTFEDNGLAKRMLFIHGHTDGQGKKEENIALGFERALAAYQEIKSYGQDLRDHVVICSHADNSAVVDVPDFPGSKLTKQQQEAIRTANQKNRRITIEDKLINQFEVE